MTDWWGASPGNSALSGNGLCEETSCADCVAASEGLEPPTLALGKPCSIRLSYEATRRDGCHAREQAPSLGDQGLGGPGPAAIRNSPQAGTSLAGEQG